MKKINIFLNDNERQKINHVKKTHNLSYSTITDIIVRNYLTFNPIIEDVKKYAENLNNITKQRKKTSIKLKHNYDLTDRQINALIFYHFYSMIDKYKNENLDIIKIKNIINQSINKAYQTTIDDWANYNAFCRMKERYQRENENKSMSNQ